MNNPMRDAPSSGAVGPVTPAVPELDQQLTALHAASTAWAQSPISARIAILNQIRDQLMKVAEGWAETAARRKLIPPGSPHAGEEWISGPYAVMSACDALITTLSAMEGKAFLPPLPRRQTASDQLAVRVMPHSIWDRLLLSGVSAEVWMQPGVTEANLAENTASAYDIPAETRQGKVALVLGAGNIASIAPLDVFHKLFSEHQVVMLKMNPVNDYLTPYLEAALRPLIDCDALRIVKGGADVGDYLCRHPLIDEIHITGAATSHDAIVWGPGAQGAARKAAGTPRISKRVTSELGAVCPTIVVPGPWSAADLTFQAEQIATQKLHNSGFNCVACQMLILPRDWEAKPRLMEQLRRVIAGLPPRAAYYPGADARMKDFTSHGARIERVNRASAPACLIAHLGHEGDDSYTRTEVFAPALSVKEIGGSDPEAYLIAAIRYANDELAGTLGANILIHPATMRLIGAKRFDALIADLRYGAIAINAWTGLAFSNAASPWGAFPGQTLEDVGSGIGTAHNSFMFDRPERVVITAPWRPFPRGLLSGSLSLLPRPPWFVTNRRQQVLGRLLTHFQHRPSLLKLPRIFLNALRG